MQSAGNSFFIRTVQPNRTTALEIPRQSISIDPACVEFTDYPSSKMSICKLTLRNQSRFPKRVTVSQAAKAYFEVKTKSRDLPPKETTQVYVVFNPQREKGRIEDEFSIKVEGEGTVLHVPIVCQYKAVGSRAWSSKQIIAAKENEEEKVGKSVAARGRRPIVSKNRHLSIDHRHSSNFVDLKRLSLTLFQEKYERISRYVEEKKVKNEVYLGEQSLDAAAKTELCEYSQRVEELGRRAVGKAVGARWTVEYREEGPVVQLFSGVALGWDPARNTQELVFRNGVAKMQEEVRKFVVSLRFQKIRNYLSIYNEYRTRQENLGKPLRVQEYLEYLSARLESNRNAGEMEFDFDKGSLRHEEVAVDYQRGPTENLFRQRSVRFEIVQRIGFDNWVPMNVLRQSSAEVYQLGQHCLPPHHLHMPASIRDNRRGALAEMPFRGGFKPEREEIAKWEKAEWPHATVGEIMKKQERYYHSEADKGVGQCVSLNEDLQDWLQDYIKDL